MVSYEPPLRRSRRLLSSVLLVVCYWCLVTTLTRADVTVPVDPIPSASPESVGLSKAKLDLITRKLEKLSLRQVIPGAAFVVIRGGKQVYTGTAGYSDVELEVPYRTNTISRIMSMSKPVTATAIMILIDEGKIKLTDPLYKFNDKFRTMTVIDQVNEEDGTVISTVPAKRPITIYDLLTFTAGFSYAMDFANDEEGPVPFPEFSPLNLLHLSTFDLEQLIDVLTAQPLAAQPGAQFYYGWSYDVLGYVIQKVTGQSADIFMAERIFRPLGMKDTGFYVPADKMNRFAAQYTNEGEGLTCMIRPRVDILQGYQTPRLILTGAGIVSTANDYARFAQMILNGGELAGVRILSEKAVDQMWRNHLTDAQLPFELNGWTSDPDTGYGYGIAITTSGAVLDVDWDEHTGSKRTGEVGWGGGATTNWQANADHDMLVVFMTQLMEGPGTEVFQDVVWNGVHKAIIGPSPRMLPGLRPPEITSPKIKYEGNQADVRRKAKQVKKEEKKQAKLQRKRERGQPNGGDHRTLRSMVIEQEE